MSTYYTDRAKKAIEVVGDCWIWSGKIGPKSIPKFSHDGITVIARRAVYEEHIGVAVKEGVPVVAECGNRLCVSPLCAREKVGGVKKKQITRKQREEKKEKRAADIAKVRAKVGMWGGLLR